MIDQNVLQGFCGTEAYHSLGALYPGVVLTDGAHYVAEHGGKSGAFWLIQEIASRIPAMAKKHEMLQGMQFWTLKVCPDKTAVLECVADSGMEPALSYKIEYTDFDLDEIKFYVQPGQVGGKKVWVIFLPSEY